MSQGTYDHDWCTRIINELLKWQLASTFRNPVDPERDGAPNYLEKVKNPIDLSTIKKKLHSNEYKTAEDFMYDVKLIYENSKIYNGENSMITFIANDILKWTETQYNQKCKSYEEENHMKLHRAIAELNEHMKLEPHFDAEAAAAKEELDNKEEINKIDDKHSIVKIEEKEVIVKVEEEPAKVEEEPAKVEEEPQQAPSQEVKEEKVEEQVPPETQNQNPEPATEEAK